MLHKFFELIVGKKAADAWRGAASFQPSAGKRYQQLEREYIEREARIGAEVFGPIPSGHDRQFFCLDKHTWVWHEEWLDQKRKPHAFVIRYEVRSDGIFKRFNNSGLTKISGQELANFDQAVRLYYQEVAKRVYDRQVAAA